MNLNLKWKKLENHQVIDDVIQYIKSYCEKYPDSQIYIGCDSQNRKHNTLFGMVIVIHKQSRGGHVLYSEEEVPRMKDNFTRLFDEAHRSLEIAEYLRNNDVQKVDYIDLDLNPDPKFGSNFVLRAAVGYVESMGYSHRTKPYALSATYAADRICK